METLYILSLRPGINKQFDTFPLVLRLFGGYTETDLHKPYQDNRTDMDSEKDDEEIKSTTDEDEDVTTDGSDTKYVVSDSIILSSNITVRKRKP